MSSAEQTGVHADHYSSAQAQAYAQHHEKNARTRLTTRREQLLLRRALRQAGAPTEVLDIPCGTGRFWPAFEQAGVTGLIAADNSQGMLDVARAADQPATMRVRAINTSVFSIALEDNAVPLVACLRFFHHLAEAQDRRRAIDELKRVSTRYVVISLWTDGNWQAWRRRKKRRARRTSGYGNRVVLPRTLVEQEFRDAGLNVVGRWHVWPFLSLWCTYLLELADADSDQGTQPPR